MEAGVEERSMARWVGVGWRAGSCREGGVEGLRAWSALIV